MRGKRVVRVIWPAFVAALMATSLVALAEGPAIAAGPAKTIYALQPGNQLIRFSSASPGSVTSVAVTGLGANQTLRGIDFRPRTGQLYGTAVPTGQMNTKMFTYMINAVTGAATFVGEAGPLPAAGDFPTGYDFNPTVDRIRYVNALDENARVNPNNGTLAGNDTDVTPAATSELIAAAYDRNFDRQAGPNDAIPTTVFAINRSNSTVVRLGGVNSVPSPNGGVATPAGPLGFALDPATDGGFDISSDQQALAALTNNADHKTRLYSLSLSTFAATPVGLIGDGNTQVFSLAIRPDESLPVTGDASPKVRVFDPVTGAMRFELQPYNFRGGMNTAVGDTTGDGVDEIVTVPGPRRTTTIRGFDAFTGAPVTGSALGGAAFPGFAGGVNLAVGDLDGDGFDEVLVARNHGGPPDVRVIDGRDGSTMGTFRAYGSAFKGGIRIATGDFDLDGLAEVVTAAGPGRRQPVRVFEITFPGGAFTATETTNFFASRRGARGGLYVATGDVTGTNADEVIIGSGPGSKPRVSVYGTPAPGTALLESFRPFPKPFHGGVRVATTQIQDDLKREIVAAQGPGGGSVRVFEFPTTRVRQFAPFGRRYTGGVGVG